MLTQVTSKTTLTEFFRQLTQSNPQMFGKELVIETAGTAATQKFAHGLGRPYKGAIQTSTTNISLLIVLDPSTQPDSAVNLSVVDVAANASTIHLWVF